jgi:hypothetical protein
MSFGMQAHIDPSKQIQGVGARISEGTLRSPDRSLLEAGQDNTETGLLWSGRKTFTEGHLEKAKTQNSTLKLFSELPL